VALAVAGCGRAREPQLFELLPPGRTGVTFANRLPDDTAFNILSYMYFYDGGGVAVGDVNNDGLPDLYFTANVGPNRLYLNRGIIGSRTSPTGPASPIPPAGRPASPWPTSTGTATSTFTSPGSTI